MIIHYLVFLLVSLISVKLVIYKNNIIIISTLLLKYQ